MMASDEVDPVFVSWEEELICQERGNRVIHFYLRDMSGNLVLAVVGTERSVRHMMYVVPQQFLQAYGSTTITYKWRARREVVDWLNHLVSRNQSQRAGELLDDSGKAVGYMYTDGISANNKKIPDKLISRNLKFQSSDIDWSGTAWLCAKQLKHYSGFDRKGTTIYVHSFVYIMAEEVNPYLGYLEDMYEDKKKQKKVKVRWFHHGQEVKRVIPGLDLREGEVFITSNVQVISAECVNGPATVLTPKHYEKYKADLLHTSSSEIHMCFRQLKNNKLKPFALTKLRGYNNQPILSDLDSPTLSKRKGNCLKFEDGENFTQDDFLRPSSKRNRSSVEYSIAEKGFSGQQNSSINEMSKDEPKYPSLKLKLSRKTMGVKVIEPKPELPFKVNDKVEFLCQDSGIRGCWFRCTILYASQKRLKVRYDDLMDADDVDKLEEWIPASRVAKPCKLGMRSSGRLTVRPRPPEFVKGHPFEVGAAVDAWCGDGWWESVITAVDTSGVGTCQVYSPGEEKYIVVETDDIRISRDWIDNRWVEILGKPDICSFLNSNVGSCAKLSDNSAVVNEPVIGSSATLESEPLPIAKDEAAPKAEQESSGLETLNGGMKRMTLWKPPLHAIHEDEDIKSDGGGSDGGDTDNADDEIKPKDRNSGSSSDGDDDDGTDNDGDDADNTGEEDSEENLVMEERFGCSEPKLDAAEAIQVT
ncbi:agenet domain-containing protein [Trifolium pratense]|uniref:Agenet domain-containing protein n=1 Tax=Trifolium pratense TaxID=57577 RepID=A0A2K3P0I0_TRIPR|nr:agenet domain-containing protein [Trifolium pratense]